MTVLENLLLLKGKADNLAIFEEFLKGSLRYTYIGSGTQ